MRWIPIFVQPIRRGCFGTCVDGIPRSDLHPSRLIDYARLSNSTHCHVNLLNVGLINTIIMYTFRFFPYLYIGSGSSSGR